MNLRLLMAIIVIALIVLPTLGQVAHATSQAGHEPEFNDSVIQRLQEILASNMVSQETKTCLGCHVQYTPGIVYEWLNSMHAKTPASEAAELYEMIGSEEWVDKISDKFKNYNKVVGCYECHGMYADQDRPDIVNHFGFNIVTVVTRKDCGQCHPKENTEISWTWHATGVIMSPVMPWYKSILAYAKDKLGANPFGDTQAKQIYEEYFPPYLTRERDKDPVYWDFYKKLATAVFNYLNGKATDEDMKIINMVKEATGGMVTPYDYDWKTWISPLWPASGVLNTTLVPRLNITITVNAMGQKAQNIPNPMSHDWFRNGLVYHACLQCHGSVVVPYKVETVNVKGLQVTRMAYWGWPNNGAARVDPDGSIGTCTACHPRHLFSIKQAREPWTCGQCHLGYDHPHIEIYEESKHGNIYDAYGESWNWERLPWRVGVDFNAPTCATCHMSTISVVDQNGNEKIVVEGTHDLVKRLVWDQMHFFSHPKPVIPDKMQVSFFLGGFSVLKGKMEDVYAAAEKIPENSPYKYPVFMGVEIKEGYKPGELGFPRLLTVEYTGELKEHREEMIKVCTLCHSDQWARNFFRTADSSMIEYDIVARYAQALLKMAWELGIHDNKNILDEYMEIMWYYIWHHDGRRWRNGVYMMGPDYAFWFGVVDTVMDKLGRMTAYFETALKLRALQLELEALKAQAGGAPYTPGLATQIAQIQQQIQQLQQQLKALEAQVPTLIQQLSKLETEFAQSSELLQEDVGAVKANIEELMSQLKQLAQQLPAGPQKEQIEKMIADIEATLQRLEQLQSKVEEAKTEAGTAKEEAASAKKAAEDVSTKVSTLEETIKSLKSSVEGMARSAYILGVIAIVIAIVAAIVAVFYKKK